VLVSGFAISFQIKRCVLCASADRVKAARIALSVYTTTIYDILPGCPRNLGMVRAFEKDNHPRRRTTMSEPTKTAKTNTDEIPHEMLDLAEAINSLPEGFRAELEPYITRVIESTRRRRRILSLVQDALSQLRLDMKYLAFDLEATRRERDDYRQKLEEAS
jgi:hypothetical protein